MAMIHAAAWSQFPACGSAKITPRPAARWPASGRPAPRRGVVLTCPSISRSTGITGQPEDLQPVPGVGAHRLPRHRPDLGAGRLRAEHPPQVALQHLDRRALAAPGDLAEELEHAGRHSDSGSRDQHRPAQAVAHTDQPVLKPGHRVPPPCARPGRGGRSARHRWPAAAGCGRRTGATAATRCPKVTALTAASSQSPTGRTYGTPSPDSPMAASPITMRSGRSAMPTSAFSPRPWARALA